MQGFARFGKISERVLSSHGLYFGEIKQVLIFSKIGQKTARLHVFSSLTKNVFLKIQVSRLEKLHSCVKACTLEFPALWRLHSFKSFHRNFVMNVSVALLSLLLNFFEAMHLLYQCKAREVGKGGGGTGKRWVFYHEFSFPQSGAFDKFVLPREGQLVRGRKI